MLFGDVLECFCRNIKWSSQFQHPSGRQKKVSLHISVKEESTRNSRSPRCLYSVSTQLEVTGSLFHQTFTLGAVFSAGLLGEVLYPYVFPVIEVCRVYVITVLNKRIES